MKGKYYALVKSRFTETPHRNELETASV